MKEQIILYNGPNSPFGRKTKITSLVQEISLEEKIINVYESDFLDKHNPLRKIPTLVINDLTIIDSDNICLHLDSISKKETKESSYLAIINDLSEDIGISTEETKSLVDVALSSTDPRNVNYEQLKQEITTFLFINIFFLICKL